MKQRFTEAQIIGFQGEPKASVNALRAMRGNSAKADTRTGVFSGKAFAD